MGLSNEVLYILAAEGATKQPEVKVGDTKNNSRPEPGPPRVVQIRPSGQIIFQTSTLTLGNFAVS